MPNMLAAAQWYATRDIPVFPVVPQGKRPLTEHGFRDASTDAGQIEAWWTEHPDANIGVPTGVRFDVIDIDGPEGMAAVKEMLQTMPVIGRVATSRDEGGAHIYVPVSGFGNKTSNKLYPGVDYRGKGGYVVAAPSVGANGKRYKWLERVTFGAEADTEHQFYAPFRERVEDASGTRSLIGVDISSYGVDHKAQTELGAAAWEMFTAPEGGRNHLLNALAYRVGRLVGAERLDESDAYATLERAAVAAGLDDHEISATLRSGISSGKKDPKSRDGDAAESEEADPTEITGLVDFAAEWEKAEDDIPWIIWPFLAERRLTAFYSVPKVGKSLVALDAAIKSSRGDAFLDHKPARAYTGLYLDCENDIRGDVIKRAKDMQYDAHAFDNLFYYSFHNLSPMDTEKGGRQVLELARKHGADFVIVDTVSRHVAGEENSNDTWLSWYNHTGKLLKGAGIAALRIDHAGKDESRGQRGGSAKGGDIDMIWRLSLEREDQLSLKLDSQRMHIPKDMHELNIVRLDNPLRHERGEMIQDKGIDLDGFGGAVTWLVDHEIDQSITGVALKKLLRAERFTLGSDRESLLREAWAQAAEDAASTD